MQSLLATVDLAAIRRNAKRVLRLSSRPLIAVVKDDAYGHGAVEVCHALLGLASAFAVATVEEGAMLRIGGVELPILVLTPPLSREEAAKISLYRLTASVGSLRTLRLFSDEFEAHIAVNTGMNRYGASPREAANLAKAVCKRGGRVTGVYSHLYAPADLGALQAQTRIFAMAAAQVKEIAPHCLAHLAATGGILQGIKFDAVRAGLALYGYLPDGMKGLDVRPAMKVYATVADAHKRVGDGMGYGYATGEEFHTLRVGYGDGFFRVGGFGEGNLCMDACVEGGIARVGSRRLLLADAAAYAARHGTTVYEVLVNISRRAEMRYLH